MKIAVGIAAVLAVGGAAWFFLLRKREPANLGELAETGALGGGAFAKSGRGHF